MTGSDDAINHAMATSKPTAPARGALVAMQYRRLRRAGIAAAAVVVGLIALRLWWGFEAQRRLDAAIERYRQNGQPVLAEEFDAQLDAVPDDQNAAILLEQAIDATVNTTESGQDLTDAVYNYHDDPVFFDENAELAALIVQLNAKALRLAREARARPEAAWSPRFCDQLRTVFVSQGNRRHLARLLEFAASYHYHAGDHSQAITTIEDLFALSHAFFADPAWISLLGGHSVQGLGTTWLEEYVPALRVVDVSGRGELVGAVSRSQVNHLIERLLEEESTGNAILWDLCGQRALYLALDDPLVFMTQLGPWFGTGTPPPRRVCVAGELARPLLTLDCLREAEYWAFAIDAMDEATWPVAATHFTTISQSRTLLHSLTHPITQSGITETGWLETRSVRMSLELITQRRMAATALAIRLYEIDNGHQPTDLQALVPEYLQSVPLDPFSPDGATIRYSNDAERPLLYSVGADGKDDSGNTTRRVDGRYGWVAIDVVFRLDATPDADDAPAFESAETGGNDQYEEDNQR
ncbi:MAG: hypothetical protein JXA69_05165 [Phycisphaerae bacterium]|nr:hypothetical protein [Phycisphaerae bacterium]